MRILLVHISDIHIKGAKDPALERAEAIASSVRDVDTQLDLCVLAVTGDIAFSGRAEEYALANAWIVTLVTCLQDALGDVPVRIAMVPGNHDCNFMDAPPARQVLIDSMSKDAEVIEDSSAAQICASVQTDFFKFRDAVAGDGLNAISRLYYEYRFSAKDQAVLIRCCNTAWVSQRDESPSKLAFPVNSIPEPPEAEGALREALVITLMHHTYNWLAPTNLRTVRKRVQSVSEFVLTGHEHEFGIKQLTDENGGSAIYVEGLALQPPEAGAPQGFNAIVVDTDGRMFRVVPYTWRQKRYQEGKHAPFIDWSPFAPNVLRAGHLFQIATDFVRALNDPGLTLVHPTRGSLTLDDIFVYPDLREVNVDTIASKQAHIVNAARLLEIVEQRKRVVVTGADESGKTVLAKRLFVDAHEHGYTPLFVRGQDVRLHGDQRDRKPLALLFEEQYDADGEAYLALPSNKRIIIVDDSSELRPRSGSPATVVQYLSQFADHLVLFANDVADLVQEITGLAPLANGRTRYDRFRILPMGHVRREELIDRYVALAERGDSQASEELRVEMRKILALAVGRLYAPANPVTIISILQARAFNEPLNLQHSAYGYYYELLVRRQLVDPGQGSNLQDFDIRLAYVTELAYVVLMAGIQPWPESLMIKFHQGFIDQRMLEINYEDIVRVLLDRGVLRRNGVNYEFKHPYVYHYFAGRALNDKLTTDEGAAKVRALTQHLDDQESANIVLFLTHHSKDPVIIDSMLERAASIFDDAPDFDLETSLRPELDAALQVAVYEDRPIHEQRREYLKRLDDGEDTGSTGEASPATPRDVHGSREVSNEITSAVGRLNVAFRTMQILGQVLKNFPGTLTGDQKERITRAIYNLARRTLGYIQQFFDTRTEQLATEVVNAIRAEHPDLSVDKVFQAARGLAYRLTYMASFGMVQRAAGDVASRKLDPVFQAIENTDPAAFVKLVSLAIKLDRADLFPYRLIEELRRNFNKNPLAVRVLRGLVLNHFYMFDVLRADKQRACKLLDIEYKVLPPQSRTRLIAAPRGS